MPATFLIKILIAGASLSALAVWIWQSNRTVLAEHSSAAHPHAAPLWAHVSLPVSPALALPVPSASKAPLDLRAQFRASGNYAQFVRGLAPAAAGGNPVAQYLIAKALKYGNDGTTSRKRFRNPDGSLRERSEIEVGTLKFPTDLQQEIIEAYDRCQDFMKDASQTDATTAWASWLDKAVAAGYPPAQSLQADVWRVAELIRDSANASAGDVIPTTMGPARDLAVVAALSGEPESIFGMLNWVDGTTHSPEDYDALANAWGLLACQRGYDGCDRSSPWLRAVCSFDAQCTDDQSVIDYLRRRFSDRFEEVQDLASSIGLAIDQKNEKAVESYL